MASDARNGGGGCWRFAGRRLDLDRRELTIDGQPVAVEPKVFDLIAWLLTHRERLVSKDELQDALWPGLVVTEASLSRTVMKARRALRDDTRQPQVILTVPRRGFRFVAAAERDQPGRRGVFLVDGLSDVHFAPSDGVHIAWRSLGEGRPDVLFCPGFVSHLDMRYRIPAIASFDEQLAAGRRLLVFDRRGVGLSDRIGNVPTIENTVADMKAVLDQARSARTFIFAVSESGPAAARFAATYPERVLGLIIYGSFARGVRADDYPHMPSERGYAGWLDTLLAGWGGPVSIEYFAPSHANDDEVREGWARYLRAAATPGSIRGILEALGRADVREILPKVRRPTLVIHRRDDRLVRVEAGRDLAARIPGARFVEVPGQDHWWFVGDTAPILAATLEFIAAHRPD